MLHVTLTGRVSKRGRCWDISSCPTIFKWGNGGLERLVYQKWHSWWPVPEVSLFNSSCHTPIPVLFPPSFPQTAPMAVLPSQVAMFSNQLNLTFWDCCQCHDAPWNHCLEDLYTTFTHISLRRNERKQAVLESGRSRWMNEGATHLMASQPFPALLVRLSPKENGKYHEDSFFFSPCPFHGYPHLTLDS